MKIKVEKPTQEFLKENKVFDWPIWTKEKSEFDWYYDEEEACYILEGKVEVTLGNGEKVTFGKGDYVVFPKGLKCKWKVIEDVKKHYNFF